VTDEGLERFTLRYRGTRYSNDIVCVLDTASCNKLEKITYKFFRNWWVDELVTSLRWCVPLVTRRCP